jgi:isoleucyl-tRNA synthetase
MDNDYIESVWWAFKQLHEKGYIYEGEKILMYCPRCSTPLAKAEIAMDNSYQTVKDETVVVKFKLKNKNAYALAWTTTPWTLPSNLALTVNPKLNYAYIKDNADGTEYLLAKDLISKYFKSAEDYKILEEVLGKKLEGIEYEPLFPYFKNTKNAFKILLGDFVTAEDGTGIVHTAPAFGEDDYAVCRKYNIPLVQPVDERGRFTKEVTDFAGKFVHDTNTEIIIFLKKAGKVVSVKKIEHEYPFCYRCDTKLIYRAIPAWFVNIQKIKPRLLELNQELNWYPEFLKDGRVKYTVETAPDWNISRNRYWATAMPIWKSADGEILVIGSIEELKKYAKSLPKKGLDLHKDFLDKVVLVKNGKEFKRIPEVLDCWFESGAMTFAQFHYPFENKEFFEKNFPAQYVAEYIGQVRAWFYYMNVLSAILFDKIPFENVVTTGTILAEDGQKMSKSKNNFPDPMLLVDKYGVDALRFYLSGSTVMNADNMNFSEKRVDEIYKKLMGLAYNVLNFYKLYESLPETKKESTNILDVWLLAKLEKLKKVITESLEDYNTIKACEEIQNFVDELSTWYVKLSRDRFSEADKEAKTTLKHVLVEFSKIIAPILPFVAENIFKEVSGKESVHLEKWPKHEKEIGNEKCLEEMKITQEIVSKGLRERDKVQIGLKWPLSTATIKCPENLSKDHQDIILAQLNVKTLGFKKAEEIEVELDTKITPKLEAEGFARELTRAIQAERKNMGLIKEDKIELFLEIEHEKAKEIVAFVEEEKERIGAKTIISTIDKKKKDLHFVEGKIKDKVYKLGLTKIINH